jgi:dienelactone hydrolase
MKKENVTYQAGQTKCLGVAVYDEAKTGKRPVVLVAHAWRGQDDFARQKAQDLAALGYLGFAADVYGNGLTTADNGEASKLMLPLFLDRPLLRERIVAAYDAAKKHPLADTSRIGAIGFCFGGLTVIELLRSGVDLKGVVSFHGVLGTKMDGQQAKEGPKSKAMKGSLLVLHGAIDPMVSPEDLRHLQDEMTESSIDWQIHIFGNTMHAFTNPMAKDKSGGMVYNEKAAIRAWQSMKNFFNEIMT